jgi:hypothetical protein
MTDNQTMEFAATVGEVHRAPIAEQGNRHVGQRRQQCFGTRTGRWRVSRRLGSRLSVALGELPTAAQPALLVLQTGQARSLVELFGAVTHGAASDHGLRH